MKRHFAKTLIAAVMALCLLALPFFSANVLAAALGDVDGKEGVTAADARLALRAAVGLEDYAAGSAEFIAADADRDGSIAAGDARLILRAAVGLELLDWPTSNKQYDTLRSGTYYFKGTMTQDGQTVPIAMGIDKNTVYVESYMDGLSMGYLLKNGNTYLLNPEKKLYHKLNVVEIATLKSAGLITEDELRATVNDMGFTSMPPLSKASNVAPGVLDGASCIIYTFDMTDGAKMKVYTSGDKMLALENVNPVGYTVSLMQFTSISSTVPLLPPADYKSKTLLGLVASMQ